MVSWRKFSASSGDAVAVTLIVCALLATSGVAIGYASDKRAVGITVGRAELQASCGPQPTPPQTLDSLNEWQRCQGAAHMGQPHRTSIGEGLLRMAWKVVRVVF